MKKWGVFQTGKRITIASIVLGINYSDSIIYVGLQCSNVIQTCFYSWGAKNMAKEMQKILLLATFQLKLDSQNSPEIQKSTVASTRESRNLKKILRRPSRRWSCDKVPGYQVYGGNSGSIYIYYRYIYRYIDIYIYMYIYLYIVYIYICRYIYIYVYIYISGSIDGGFRFVIGVPLVIIHPTSRIFPEI